MIINGTEHELNKRYYSIGNIAKLFDVATSLIRYWETEFSVIKPKKDKKGERQYTVKDVRAISKVYHLVKERGFTLEGAKMELKNQKKAKDVQIDLLISKLENIKKSLMRG